jgi:hypothetical protein
MHVEVCPPPTADDQAVPERLGRTLAGTPWSVRRARGSGSRLALEIYEAGSLADIVVAAPIASPILRGARRSGAFGLAWGRLPADGQIACVTFTAGWPRQRAAVAEVIEVAELAWLAIVLGRFATVSAAHRGGVERLGLRARSLW